ncbi:P-loop containing nucleoside triphosphate hydrolase protein [Sistotremastrum niveocremeum HHB9708]|uniref:p-loop containing nucleoside triphosphate hydrolase protein n=1 Tax=Sistotremastrum niveocremeum HHB9708 TaxID=1314777 RepID=A0A164MSM0_9AGAM|nr:P-loop containing nucleoside triphosphate hydrolase protein [Sistotremastrum niveocremeum HHB9708]
MDSQDSNILSSEYATRRKRLMALITQLRGLGAQADLDLPRIVCIGNQSAGKSSLVEAISGITVPRDAGTCTRCPTECRLTASSGKWECQISLRIEFDTKGKRLSKPKIVQFGAIIKDKTLVEIALRRAQAQILAGDPTDKGTMSKLLMMNEDEIRTFSEQASFQKFSKNTICLDITAPDVVDFQFIDLPGIIQNAEPELVNMVETMVTENITGNSIILVTLPMSDDLENQKAARLAQIADPEGRRTIGVLTKPDTLTAGSVRSRANWVDIIEGRKHPLHHGYYCTRQPDDSERARKISPEEARRVETEFFQKTEPWNTCSEPSRFGTKNLVDKLSNLLTHITDQALPALRQKVDESLTASTAQLRKLPPPLTMDPSSELLSMITGFSSDAQSHVNGTDAHVALVQENRSVYRKFKIAIRKTAPEFRPFLKKEANGAALARWDDSAVVDEEPLEPSDKSPNDPVIYLDDLRKHIRSSRTHELPDIVPYPAKLQSIEAFVELWEDPISECFTKVNEGFKRTLIDLIHEHFSRFPALEANIRSLVNSEIEKYESKTLQLLQDLRRLEKVPFTQNEHYLSVTTDKWHSHYKAVRAGAVDGPTGKRKRIAADQGTTATAKPAAPPATPFAPPNGFGLPSSSPFAFSGMVGTAPPAGQAEATTSANPQTAPAAPALAAPKPASFAFNPAPSPSPALTANFSKAKEDVERRANILHMLAVEGYEDLTFPDLDRLRAPDEYETELKFAAEVRAYFQVSYKRIIDFVPLMINHNYLSDLVGSLQRVLILGLALGDVSRAAAYLAEDPQVVSARTKLSSKQKRLLEVRNELVKFGV